MFEFFDGRDPRTMLVTSIPDAVVKVGLDQFMALRPAILADQAPPAVAAAATHFAVAAVASITAGSAFSFTVTALDQSNNVDTGYAGTVYFTSSDGQAVLPANATLSNGFGTFSATLKTAGNQTITATDTSDATITGTSLSVVSPAGATQFWVAAPGWMMTGWTFNFTVTAKDQFGNTATGYAGTVHFTSSDGQAVLPTNTTLSNRVRHAQRDAEDRGEPDDHRDRHEQRVDHGDRRGRGRAGGTDRVERVSVGRSRGG